MFLHSFLSLWNPKRISSLSQIKIIEFVKVNCNNSKDLKPFPFIKLSTSSNLDPNQIQISIDNEIQDLSILNTPAGKILQTKLSVIIISWSNYLSLNNVSI